MNILEYTFSRTPLQELFWQASLRIHRNLHRNPPPCLYQWRYHPCLVWRHRHRSVCRHQPHPVCNDICHTQRFRRTMDFLTQGHTSGLRHCHVLDSGHECGHHLLFPYSRFHARPAIFSLRQHSHHRHRRSLAVGHSHGICLHTLYSFSTTHPKCGIRPHLFSFAASSRRPDRIYDDGTHRHDHRRHPQDGGYSPCHQSAYHSTDDGQYLHLQLQAAYPLQHHRGLVRLPHRAPRQLSVQCSLRSHHHLCKYPHFCPLQDNKSRHISVL